MRKRPLSSVVRPVCLPNITIDRASAIIPVGNGDNGFVDQCVALFEMDRFDLVDSITILVDQEADRLAKMYGHVVFVLFPQKGARPYARITVPNELETFIEALAARGVRVSCVLFVSRYTVSTVEKSDDIIIAYENNTYAYKAVLDLLLKNKQGNPLNKQKWLLE
jgi:hypothetical protein